ncbi:hypothetical protein C8R44DRAFT_725443 [Mycena epipterygia]|nr:hypothetical protein C8R44DRAFT_725443 [Mycena epipterygia]
MQKPEPNLPPELTDQIIGWIGASTTPRSSLSSCSIVCKDWLPASRSHLFRSIHITITTKNTTHWKSVVQSPHLRAYLRYAEILVRSRSYQAGRAQIDSLYSLLLHIPPLSTVTSLCVDVLSSGRLQFDTLFKAFPNIIRLTLRDMHTRDNLQLMKILSGFGFLAELSLEWVRVSAFVPIPDSQPLVHQLYLRLRTLKIIYPTPVSGAPDCMHATFEFPLMSVRHLELRDVPAAELASAGLLLRHLSEHLGTLVLSFAFYVDFASLPIYIQPQSNTNLRHLHLILCPAQHSSWKWMCCFLAEIPSAMETLIIELNGDFHALVDVDWGLLERTLEGPQFAVLRTLELSLHALELRAPPHDHDAEAFVARVLPGMNVRGILRVKSQL